MNHADHADVLAASTAVRLGEVLAERALQNATARIPDERRADERLEARAADAERWLRDADKAAREELREYQPFGQCDSMVSVETDGREFHLQATLHLPSFDCVCAGSAHGILLECAEICDRIADKFRQQAAILAGQARLIARAKGETPWTS